MELVILILLLAVAVAAGVAVITVLHRVTKEDERILAEQAAATAAVAETTEAAEEDGAATEAVVAEEAEESTPVETAEEVSAEEVTEADEATEAELNGDSVTFSAAKETLSQKYLRITTVRLSQRHPQWKAIVASKTTAMKSTRSAKIVSFACSSSAA